MVRLICLLMGYACGLVQTACMYGQAHGSDIREKGSGNAGTTNTLRVFGTKAGLLVFAGDCLKCIFAVLLVRLLFGQSHGDIIYLLCLYTAAGAILGHNYPFYMGFRGGKGIAVTAGFVLSFHPYFIILGVLMFFGIFFTTHYVSLGSLLVYVSLLIEMIICGQCGVFQGMSQANLIEMYILMSALTALAFWKHRSNIVRLIHGEERKTYLTKKNKLDVEKKEQSN